MATVYREPIKIVRDILKGFMQLSDDQIMFTNQKFAISTMGMYLYLSYVGPAKILSSQSELVDDGSGGMQELSSVTLQDMIQIGIMSYNIPAGGNDARQRREEIAMAMASIYAQQTAEKYGVQVARNVGPFLDASFLEETEMVTRYVTTVTVTSSKQLQRSTNEFYSDFARAVPPQLVVNQ